MPELRDFDPAAVIALIRSGDDNALRYAYLRTFTGEYGRTVLLHMMREAGIGSQRGMNLTGEDRAYLDGRAAAVLRAAANAGFDDAATITSVLTDTLEGHRDERDAATDGSAAEPIYGHED